MSRCCLSLDLARAYIRSIWQPAQAVFSTLHCVAATMAEDTAIRDAQAAADEQERRSFVFNPFDDEKPVQDPPLESSRRRSSTNAMSLHSSSSSSNFSLIDVRQALPSPSLPSHMQSSASSIKAKSTPSSNNSPITSIFPAEELVSSPANAAVANPWLAKRSNSGSSHSSASIGPVSKQPSTMSFGSAPSGQPPVAGFRIPATGSATLASFPVLDICGPAFKDKTGQPVYVCSAILGTSVHPAKCGPHLDPPVRWSFGGKEKTHDGRFDLLPITSE